MAEIKSARLKCGLQLLRDVSYLGKAYVKAISNDNGTLGAVNGSIVLIGVTLLAVAQTAIYWLLDSKRISEKCSGWLFLIDLILTLILTCVIAEHFYIAYNQRRKSLLKVECVIERLLHDFTSPEYLNDDYDKKIMEYTAAFEWLKTAFNKAWIVSPLKIDFIRAAEVLDEDFTYKAMDICRWAGLSYRDGLPECVLKNLNEDGTLKREVHDKYFAH